MRRKTQVPSIPEIRDDNVKEVIQAIKNTLLVREGNIGDPLDQVATLRDLVALNVAEQSGTGETTNSGGSLIPITPVLPPITGGYVPETDYTTPPAPTGLRVSGGFTNVFLEWDGAPYRNHSYTEIWRGTLDNLGAAVLIGTTAANVYADAAEANTTYYYWIRFVSRANVTGAYNLTSGTSGTTAIDVSAAFAAVTEEVQNSQLFADLSSRIANAEAGITQIQQTTATSASQITTLSSQVNNNSTALQVQSRVSDGLSAQYTVKIDNNGHVSGFGLASTALNGTPLSEFIIRADRFAFVNPSDYKLGISLISTTPGAAVNISSLQNESTVTITTTAAHGYSPGNVITIAGVTSDTRWNTTYTVLTVPSTTSFTVLAVNRRFNGFTGTITARLGAGTTYSVSSIVPGTIYGLCTTSTAHNLSFGQGLTIAGVTNDTQWNKDWVIAGEIINSTQFRFTANIYLTSPATGTMTVTPWGMASITTASSHSLSGGDKFSLSGVSGGAAQLGWNRTWEVSSTSGNIVQFRYPSYLPASPTITNAKIGQSAVPFIIDGEKTYIQTALIKDATITSAKIQDLVADKITTGNLTAAVGVTTGRITGGVNTSFTIGSVNFGTGFYLGNDAGVYKLFVGSPDQNMLWNGSALSVKGTVDALAGSIGGVLIANQGLQSTNYVAGSAGWRITANGTFEASSGTFRGSLSGATITGATGTFSGALSAASGTIGGLQIASTYIQSSNYVAGSTGYRLNSNGTAEFGDITARGDITANSLTANVVNTSNIVGAAVTTSSSASSTTATVSVTISVPASTSLVLITAYSGDEQNIGTAKDPSYLAPLGTISINGAQQTQQRGSIVLPYINPAAGSYTISMSRDATPGTCSIAALLYKR